MITFLYIAGYFIIGLCVTEIIYILESKKFFKNKDAMDKIILGSFTLCWPAAVFICLIVLVVKILSKIGELIIFIHYNTGGKND